MFPLAEELGLVPSRPWSPRLHEAIRRLGAGTSGAPGPEALACFTQVRRGAEPARRLTAAAGAALVAVETAAVAALAQTGEPAAEPAAPLGPAGPPGSGDGALVPLLHGAWGEVKPLAVGTVGTRRDREGATVAVTQALSDFTRLTDRATFPRLALGELPRRGTFTAGVVGAPMDGAPWLQHVLDHHRPEAVRLRDFPTRASR